MPLSSSSSLGQTREVKALQRFVNGDLPVKEATVYRKLTRADGKLQNEEWWRFAWQRGTWYVQRLQPDSNNPALLVPRPDSAICGASFSGLWAISDKDTHVAAKTSATNSLLEKNVGKRNMMLSALSLGLPRILDVQDIEEAPIEWNALEFKTSVATKRGNKYTILGKLSVDANGLPASAEYSGIEEFPGGLITYEYNPESATVPTVFTAKYAGSELRYEFLSITLGSNDLSNTGGYVPSLFAHTRGERRLTLWTNDRPYSVIQGKIVPAFEMHHRRRPAGSIILIILAVITATFLMLLYRHSEQTKNQKGQIQSDK